MHQIVDNISTIKVTPRRRRRRGNYCSSLERRAAVAAGMIEHDGWTARQAAGLVCVNPSYVSIVRHLGADDRLRVARGELKLSALYKDYRQRLAKRRAQRLADERAAKVQAERAAQVAAVDGVLESVGLDCVVGRIVERHGPRQLLEELDVALQRRGQDLAGLVVNVCPADRLMAALDMITAPPHAVAAE
jgi:hypothetical protein